MTTTLRTSLLMLLATTLLTGVIYPLGVTAIAQALMPGPANGSLVERDGRAVGSSLIGQPFHQPKYFRGRPSATAPGPYNAAASGGSNLGPLNPALRESVQARIDEIRRLDAHRGAPPADLVTASGSGLDPHISPAAAELQVARVASARGLPEDEVRRLVNRHTEGPQLGLLGEPRVNVLLLNLALDEAADRR